MNEGKVKRIAMVVGLSALALTAAVAVDQSDAASAGAAATMPGAAAPAAMMGNLVTTSTTAMFASPTVHATYEGKCVKSSPQC